MSGLSVPDSCRALWPVLIQALHVLATKSPQLLALSAVNVSYQLQIVGGEPETIVLVDELRDLAKRLEAQEGSIDAALWMLEQAGG